MAYGRKFQARMVAKLLQPNCRSASVLSAETGVSQATLSRWLRDAGRVGGMDPKAKKWTASEKLRVVQRASEIKDAELGEFLRSEGLHEEAVRRWRSEIEVALGDGDKRRRHSPEARRIKELEREIRRKDKALAEVSAILVLKKKAAAIWGDGDDDTPEKTEP